VQRVLTETVREDVVSIETLQHVVAETPDDQVVRSTAPLVVPP
jgi:hypothetical protein